MNIKNLIVRLKGEPVKQKAEETEALILRDAFTAYIWDCRKNKTFSEPTIDSYEIIRDKHLESIMDENVFGLTEEQIQQAFDFESEKGLSANTIKKYKTVLLRVLEAYRPGFACRINVKKGN